MASKRESSVSIQSRTKRSKKAPEPLALSDYTPTLLSAADTDRYTHIQARLCQNYRNVKVYECCQACIQRQSHVGGCRFLGVRAFAVPTSDNPKPKSKPDFTDYVWRNTQDDAPVETKKPKVVEPKPKRPSRTTRGNRSTRNQSYEDHSSDEQADPEHDGPIPTLPPVQPPTYDEAIYAIKHFGPPLAEQVERELAHENNPTPTIRIRCTPETRSLCDLCMTGIYMGSYMCGLCGREICLGCWEEWSSEPQPPSEGEEKVLRRDICSKKRKHRQKNFLFVTRAKPGELERLLKDIRARLASPALTQNPLPTPAETTEELPAEYPCVTAPSPDEGPSYLPVPTFPENDLTLDRFRRIWSHGGTPLVLRSLLPHFTLPWSPRYFTRHFGSTSCIIHDCTTSLPIASTVADFFATFDTPTASSKLKDWPPTDHFASTFPLLFADFESAIPFPSYTRRTAALNLAAHFPAGWNAPDLGPKMYNATPARDFLAFGAGATEGGKMEIVQDVKGTTNLHLDLTDAVNILLYAAGGEAAPAESTEPKKIPLCGAIWDIFPPASAGPIRRYLKETRNPPHNILDPIHSQAYYLSEHDLTQLGARGVRSYRIFQDPGDAVFIPAGCPHQVRNRRSCVKVAVDFLSPENVGVCRWLGEEARGLARRGRNQGGGKEDVLQLWGCLGFAWNALERVVREAEGKEEGKEESEKGERGVKDEVANRGKGMEGILYSSKEAGKGAGQTGGNAGGEKVDEGKGEQKEQGAGIKDAAGKGDAGMSTGSDMGGMEVVMAEENAEEKQEMTEEGNSGKDAEGMEGICYAPKAVEQEDEEPEETDVGPGAAEDNGKSKAKEQDTELKEAAKEPPTTGQGAAASTEGEQEEKAEEAKNDPPFAVVIPTQKQPELPPPEVNMETVNNLLRLQKLLDRGANPDTIP